MWRHMGRVAGLALVAALLGACGAPAVPTPIQLPTLPPLPIPPSTQAATSAAPTVPALTPTEPPSISTPGTPQAADPAIAVEAAIQALAQELGLSPGEIALISALPSQWDDASLGCPQPGQVYPPIVTQGYLVTLAARDSTYNVHTDLTGTAIVCLTGSDGMVTDPIVAEFIEQGRADLAETLDVAPEAITLVSSEAVDWLDSSLGCAIPDGTYVEVITPGYRIIFAVEEARYEYHTDTQRMLLCDNPTE